MEFELLIDAKAGIAETPVWDGRVGRLYWTDVMTGDIHGYDPQSGTELLWETGRAIGSAIPCEDAGKLFCALEDGLFVLDLDAGKYELVCNPDGRTGFRYNDSRIDAKGRILTSTVSKLYGTDEYRPDLLGRFYLVDTDGTVVTLADEVNQYNGIAWNQDSTKMYVVDTHNSKLLMFPYDIERGPTEDSICALDLDEFGMPDGLSIDAEDTLYICHWSGKISVWDKDLKHIDTIIFPVDYVCCGGFGGPDGKEFFVASSSWNYTDADFKRNPGAGGIFAGRSETPGRPENFYPSP